MSGEQRGKLRVWFLGNIAGLVLRVLGWTLRWESGSFESFEAAWCTEGPKIIAFWHGRILGMPVHYLNFSRKRPGKLFVLISRHADGRIIAQAVELFGIGSIAGSSTRGALGAFLALVKTLEEGTSVAITPDGPRGPRQECKKGVVALAQQTKVPVIPVTFSVKRYWQLRSWDGMIVPKPFSRAVLVIGEPIQIAADEDLEASRVSLQSTMNKLTALADEYWANV